MGAKTVLKEVRVSNFKASLLAGAAFVAFVGLPSGAKAADDTATDQKVEKVTVTGSRIPKKDYSSNSPISTVTAQQIKDSGSTTIDQLLNTLPQVVPGFGRGQNNGTAFGGNGGLATVNLRGLGDQRNLVLVNGHRITPATENNEVDLNNIPPSLIERIEVVTGGASAVYGSDAISGVINIILKHDFQGAQLDTSYKISDRGDGAEWQISGTVGANSGDGKGNVELFGSYYSRDGLLDSDRSFSAMSNSHVGEGLRASSTSPAGRFDNVASNNFAAQNDGLSAPTTDPVASDPLYDPAVGGGGCTPASTSRNIAFGPLGATTHGFCNVAQAFGGDRFNFSPANFLIDPGKAYNMASLGQYNLIGDSVVGYMEAYFSNNKIQVQQAPSPATGFEIVDPLGDLSGTSAMNTFLLTPAIRSTLQTRPVTDALVIFRKRLLAIGDRAIDNESNYFQFVTGLKGDLGDGWEYDTYVNYGENNFQNQTFNEANKEHLLNALRNKVDETACGGPAGRSIPLYGDNALSAADICYLKVPVLQNTVALNQTVFSASLTGEPIQLPAGPLGISFGFEYRSQKVDVVPDAVIQSHNTVGFNGAGPVAGGFDVYEEYVEANIPLVSDVFLVKYLGLEAGYRYSDYTLAGNPLTTQTYKYGAEWKPFEDIRFRGMFERADRAPNLFELFENGDQSFTSVRDPCAGATGVTKTNCIARFPIESGGSAIWTPAFAQVNTQIEEGIFGNKNLKDEKADTITLGMTVTPSGWKNFNAAIDYWNVDIQNAITNEFGGPAAELAACYKQAVPDLVACSGFVRDAAGTLIMSHVFKRNESSIKTDGVDFQAQMKFNADDFGLDPADGSLSIFALGSWMRSYKINGGEAVGVYFEAATLPELSGSMQFTYSVADWRFGWDVRYIDHMREASFGYFVPAIYYNDANVSWDISDHVKLYAVVNDVFDEQPFKVEQIDLAGTSAVDTSRYDVVGRSYQMGMTVRY